MKPDTIRTIATAAYNFVIYAVIVFGISMGAVRGMVGGGTSVTVAGFWTMFAGALLSAVPAWVVYVALFTLLARPRAPVRNASLAFLLSPVLVAGPALWGFPFDWSLLDRGLVLALALYAVAVRPVPLTDPA